LHIQRALHFIAEYYIANTEQSIPGNIAYSEALHFISKIIALLVLPLFQILSRSVFSRCIAFARYTCLDTYMWMWMWMHIQTDYEQMCEDPWMLVGGVSQNLLGPAALKREAQALSFFAPVISKTDWYLFCWQASLLNYQGRTVLPNRVLCKLAHG
jgi:hypothetical protein